MAQTRTVHSSAPCSAPFPFPLRNASGAHCGMLSHFVLALVMALFSLLSIGLSIGALVSPYCSMIASISAAQNPLTLLPTTIVISLTLSSEQCAGGLCGGGPLGTASVWPSVGGDSATAYLDITKSTCSSNLVTQGACAAYQQGANLAYSLGAGGTALFIIGILLTVPIVCGACGAMIRARGGSLSAASARLAAPGLLLIICALVFACNVIAVILGSTAASTMQSAEAAAADSFGITVTPGPLAGAGFVAGVFATLFAFGALLVAAAVACCNCGGGTAKRRSIGTPASPATMRVVASLRATSSAAVVVAVAPQPAEKKSKRASARPSAARNSARGQEL